MSIHDLVGLCGIALIVTAYLLLQTERLASDSLNYSLINLVGALLILYSIAFEFNLSACLVEVFWVLISLLGVVRYFRKQPLPEEP